MDFSGGLADRIFKTLTFLCQLPASRYIIRQVERRKDTVNPDDDKYVALTFDDGPDIHTDRLLDILRENDSRATFFLTGNKLDSHKDVAARYIKEGHDVGNHLFSHTPLPKLSSSDINEEIEETDRIFKEVTSQSMSFIRAPHGEYPEESKKAPGMLDKPLIGWNVDTYDYIYKMGEMVEHRLLNKVNDGSIVLLHDTHESTVDAIEKCLPKLKEQGFRFVNLSTLFTKSSKTVSANHLYSSVDDFIEFNEPQPGTVRE